MELIKKKAIMRAVNIIALLISLHISGYCQYVNDGQYFSFEKAKSEKQEMISISGIVLDSDSIKPIIDLPPVITYLNWNSIDKSKFHYAEDGVYNKDEGSFYFSLPPGKYKFMCSQLGYTEILTDWIKIKQNDIGVLFLIEKYKSGGFH